MSFVSAATVNTVFRRYEAFVYTPGLADYADQCSTWWSRMREYLLRLGFWFPLQSTSALPNNCWDSDIFLTRIRSKIVSGERFRDSLNLLRFTRKPKALQHLSHCFRDRFLGKTSLNVQSMFTVRDVQHTFLKSNKPTKALRISTLSGLDRKSPSTRLSIRVQPFRNMERLFGLSIVSERSA